MASSGDEFSHSPSSTCSVVIMGWQAPRPHISPGRSPGPHATFCDSVGLEEAVKHAGESQVRVTHDCGSPRDLARV